MTVLVGYSPHREDLGALDLACQLARSDRTDVAAVTVVPQGWPTAVAGDSDRDFSHWAAEQGVLATAAATAYLREHGDVPSQARWVSGRSVPPVLLEEAAASGADVLVLGSGEDVAHGQIGITSKTDRLLHSSTVPVAVAPRGYQAEPGTTVHRITLAFRGDDPTWALLRQVAGIALRNHASVRVVTFAVRARTMYPPRVSGAEDMVLKAWVETAHAEQERARQHLSELGVTDGPELRVAVGRSWGVAMDSLDWERGDVLVVGSSSTHRLSRVFLGSSASKILRHSPVPVVVVP
jgi:nucleotide-binding universal stress UspA family protein